MILTLAHQRQTKERLLIRCQPLQVLIKIIQIRKRFIYNYYLFIFLEILDFRPQTSKKRKSALEVYIEEKKKSDENLQQLLKESLKRKEERAQEKAKMEREKIDLLKSMVDILKKLFMNFFVVGVKNILLFQKYVMSTYSFSSFQISWKWKKLLCFFFRYNS